MTGCMYISPSDVVDGVPLESPLIMSDVIATLVGAEGLAILPTTVHRGNVAEKSTVRLKRKSYIIADRAAVAFAGDGRVIEECLDECAAQMPAWLLTDRPMQRFTDFINEFDGVRTIGATIEPNTRQLNHIWPYQDRRHLKHLGLCAAIGSGAPELWRCAENFEHELDGMEYVPAAGRANTLPWQVNMYSLAAEIDGRVADWGGYIETMSVAPGGERWTRGPRAAHYFFQMQNISEEEVTFRMISRIIAYDPGGNDGRILSASQEPDGSPFFQDFLVENILTPSLPGEVIESDEFWGNWKPEMASVTVLGPNNSPNNFSIANRIIDSEDIDQVYFEIGNGDFKLGISNALADSVGAHVAALWGRRYVPSRDVRQ